MEIIIKTFKTPRGNYFYDRASNEILSISKLEYDVLSRIENEKALEGDFLVLKRFQEKGFCHKNKLCNIEHPEYKFLKDHLENRVEKLTLQVTQNCNLRCKYCAYSGAYNQRTHANRTMSIDIMKKSVDFIMNRSRDIERINIGFYGGEPFLEIDKIKECIDYVKKEYKGKDVLWNMTTNGTIFNNEIIEFLIENNFKITISFDGPRELHNINRVFANGVGSFDTIMKNMRYIKNTYPRFFENFTFNSVVAPKNDLKCINDFFNASDVIEDNMLSRNTLNIFSSKENIVYDDLYFITNKYQVVKILMSELKIYNKAKISKLYMSDFIHIKKKYLESGVGLGSAVTAHPGGPCIPGEKRAFVDVEGILYPCERVSESSDAMRIGDIYHGYDLDKIGKILNIGRLTKKECIVCWNFTHCGLCASSADKNGELSGEERLKHCDMEKNNTLDIFKTICLLKEYGYDFEEEIANG